MRNNKDLSSFEGFVKQNVIEKPKSKEDSDSSIISEIGDLGSLVPSLEDSGESIASELGDLDSPIVIEKPKTVVVPPVIQDKELSEEDVVVSPSTPAEELKVDNTPNISL